MVLQIPTEFHVFRRTQDTFKRERSFDYGVVTPTTDLSRSLRLPRSFVTPYRMSLQPQEASLLVWLCSVSLAATQEIAFAFSSSRYLDVSVPGSVFLTLCIQIRILYHYVWWFPPFGNLNKAYLQLPKHIGVSPVLHRLLVSRHPPCALLT